MADRFRSRAALSTKDAYGVLVGTVKAGQLDVGGNSPHYEIWIVADTNYRIAVNVQSTDGSEVLAYSDSDYTDPTNRNLPALANGPAGFTPLATGPDGIGLDYLRDDLFPLADMQPIADDGSGTTLQTILDAQVRAAMADSGAVAIAFGDMFVDQTADPNFGFSPDNGVHDIHMMQGNSGDFASDNRINGDGALFIRFSTGTTFALFVRFDTQAIVTDQNGDPTTEEADEAALEDVA